MKDEIDEVVQSAAYAAQMAVAMAGITNDEVREHGSPVALLFIFIPNQAIEGMAEVCGVQNAFGAVPVDPYDPDMLFNAANLMRFAGECCNMSIGITIGDSNELFDTYGTLAGKFIDHMERVRAAKHRSN